MLLIVLYHLCFWLYSAGVDLRHACAGGRGRESRGQGQWWSQSQRGRSQTGRRGGRTSGRGNQAEAPPQEWPELPAANLPPPAATVRLQTRLVINILPTLKYSLAERKIMCCVTASMAFTLNCYKSTFVTKTALRAHLMLQNTYANGNICTPQAGPILEFLEAG